MKERALLEYMLKGNSITSLEAINGFGITRLSACIFNFRKKYDVIDWWEECTDRFGNTSRFKRYKILKELKWKRKI